jgi:hypothetical protein
MEYELTTIKDVFDNVPVDKIELCLKELAAGIIQAKSMNNIMCEVAAGVLGEKPDAAIEWPETCTWIDDEKGEIDLSFVDEDGAGIELKTTINTIEES